MGRRLLPLALALAAAALALPASASAAGCPGADTPISALTIAQSRDAVLCLVDAERTARGLNALTRSSLLEAAAQGHTDDMVLRSFFAHVDPDGADPGDRVSAAGYDWSAVGENIAVGYSTPARVMTGWMRSTGHCRNVLDPGYTQLGVGVAVLAATLPVGNLGTWTQNFGRPVGTPAPATDTAPRDGCPYAGLQDVSPAPGTPATGDAPGGTTIPGTGRPTTSTPGTTPGTGTQTPAPTTTGDPTGNPHEGDDQGTVPLRLTLRLRRASRGLTVSGTTTAAGQVRVRITVGHRVRTLVVTVVDGRYRRRVALPRGARRVTVVARAGTLTVRRSLG